MTALSDQDHLFQVAVNCLRTSRLSDAQISAAIGYSGKNGPRDLERFVEKRCKNVDDRRMLFWKYYFEVIVPRGSATTSFLFNETAAYKSKLTPDVLAAKEWSLGRDRREARPCAVCHYPTANHADLMKHIEEVHTAVSPAALPPKKQQPSVKVTLKGVALLFKEATTKDSAALAELFEASAHHEDDSIVVKATKADPDTFKVSGNDLVTATRFVEGLQAFWGAHLAGVQAVLSSFKDDALVKAYTSKMFPNFAEPVQNVRAVVVLQNPVHTDLDQRRSTTVDRFWTRFSEAGGDVGKWMSHVVFLDLVPLLSSGKRDNLSDEEKAENKAVTKAATQAIFTKYAITRILHYVAQANLRMGDSFPVFLCSGKSAWKRAAVDDFKAELLRVPNADLCDCVYHPTANESRQIVPVLKQFLDRLSASVTPTDGAGKKGGSAAPLVPNPAPKFNLQEAQAAALEKLKAPEAKNPPME